MNNDVIFFIILLVFILLYSLYRKTRKNIRKKIKDNGTTNNYDSDDDFYESFLMYNVPLAKTVPNTNIDINVNSIKKIKKKRDDSEEDVYKNITLNRLLSRTNKPISNRVSSTFKLK